MLSQEFAEQIGFHLTEVSRATPLSVAFLLDGETVFFAHGNPAGSDTPVVRLIQAVYDHSPGQARRILRSRIFSTGSATETCLGMLKVAAKRLTSQVVPNDRGLKPVFQIREIHPLAPPPLLDLNILSKATREFVEKRDYMRAAFDLAEEIPVRNELYDSDRKVAAILVSKDGDFIAASRNANAKNRTRHAEINLVQGLLHERGSKIPVGSHIYVTLKCCKMCAAMIWCAAEDIRSLQVHYGRDDTGPNAKTTVFTPHSYERKRVSHSKSDLSFEVERKPL